MLKFLSFCSVIGKGGEQISRIQQESGCKIQIASGKSSLIIKINIIYKHGGSEVITNVITHNMVTFHFVFKYCAVCVTHFYCVQQ